MKLTIFPNDLKYTSSEQAIIQYLETNPEKFDELTIGSLARASLTSNASIIRLSRKAGFKGFKNLKVALIKQRELQRYHNNDVDFSFPFLPIDELEKINTSMNDLYLNSINLLRDKIQITEIEQAAKTILRAKRIFVYGIGDSGLSAKSFINKVNKLNLFPNFVKENDDEISITKQIKHDDVAIFVSYDQYTEEFKNVIDQVLVSACDTILITANPNSRLYRAATVTITIPQAEKERKVATFYSQFAFRYILNLIFALLYKNKILN